MIKNTIHADMQPFVVNGNKAWGVDYEQNFLFEIDLEKCIAKYKGFLGEDISAWRGNYARLMYKNEVICLPDRSHKIYFYDIFGESLESIEINSEIVDRYCETAYIVKNNILFMCSHANKIIVIVDLDRKIILDYKLIDIEEKVFDSCSQGDYFYLLTYKGGINIYGYDIESNTIEKIYADNISSDEYRRISISDERFWLSGVKRRILVYDKRNSQSRTLALDKNIYQIDWMNNCIIENENKFNNNIFVRHYDIDDSVWFFPLRGDKIVYVNKNDYTVNTLELDNAEETMETITKRKNLDRYTYSLEAILGDATMIMYSYRQNAHFFFDSKRKRIIRKIEVIDFRDNCKYLRDLSIMQGLIIEDISGSLNDFLKIVK